MLDYDKKKIPCRQDLHFCSLGLWRKHDSSELQRLRYQKANKNKLSYYQDLFSSFIIFCANLKLLGGLNSEVVNHQRQQKYWL